MEGQRLRTAETLSTAQDNTPQRNPLLSPPSLFSLLSYLSYTSFLFRAQNYQNYLGKSTAWKSLWSLFPNSGSLYRIPVMSCPPWCECTRGNATPVNILSHTHVRVKVEKKCSKMCATLTRLRKCACDECSVFSPVAFAEDLTTPSASSPS